MKKIFYLLIQDAVLLVGVFCVVYGVFKIYEPAAYIVAGSALVYAGSKC